MHPHKKKHFQRLKKGDSQNTYHLSTDLGWEGQHFGQFQCVLGKVPVTEMSAFLINDSRGDRGGSVREV